MKRPEDKKMAEHVANKGHEIFLLMLNLSQLKSVERIIDFFLSAMENMWDGVTFQFETHPGKNDPIPGLWEEFIPAATPKRNFGIVIASGDNPGEKNMALVRNAARLLAIILENREQERLLTEKNITLEQAVNERTRELEEANEALKTKISEQERLEQQLLRKQKMEAIGKLAGGIAHDFNNILGAIIGYTELAFYKTPETSPVRNYLERVLLSSDRARKIVSQILTFCCKNPAEKSYFHLEPVVEDTLNMLHSTFPSTVGIRFKPESCAHAVYANETQVQQILMNICSNAVDAMEEMKRDGLLEVGLKEITVASGNDFPVDLRPGQYFYLTVKDNGSGIDENVIEQIFDPFFTTRSKSTHSGMGLAVVHGIVQSCGGAIRAKSRPCHGTEIEVFLPAETGIPAESVKKEKSLKPCTGGNETVLFVDDEVNLVDIGKTMLGQYGYSVVGYNCSNKALEAFESEPERFQLVITDQTMPHMTGVQLALKLRAIKPDTPVILCTGFSDTVDIRKIKETGIRAFVNKPYSQKEIIAIVRSVLDRCAQV